MSIFVRTDMPVPPGTASISSTTVNSGTIDYTTPTIYWRNFSVDAYSEATIASLTITLTKRSVVIIVVSSFMSLQYSNVFRHIIRVNGTAVYISPYDPDTRAQLRVHATHVVLSPGTHTIEYRVFNGSDTPRGVSVGAAGSDLPALTLLVFVIPLE